MLHTMCCTQSQLDSARRWREKNKEKAKVNTKAWRMSHKPRFNELRKIWRSNNIVRSLFSEAKSRSKRRGVDFTIQLEDIPPMGDCCPLFGTPWPVSTERNGLTTPSLDRIDPTKGYIPGNVWVVGRRANMIKNDGTAEEHKKIYEAMLQVIK